MDYKNPILFCDYSDPDVCRVGEDFYLTASSFNFVPGLPVLHSKDLVNWNLINYACKTISLEGYDKVQNAKGIWAPSIRFHDGRFYIFFATPDEGIFYTSSKDPSKEWSELECVWKGKGFIDPCPLWDDDGKVWLVHAYAKSRTGFNSKLGLLELDPNTLRAISEDKFIFDGTKTQPTIEGPKFYKRNGFYYIFAPAGGVTKGWQTVLRSRNIDGNYQEKIVLAQGKSKINGPHQGGWIQNQNGEDWFIHFQDTGIFGRITHLQPMRWIDDWPVMGNAVAMEDKKALSVIGEPVKKWKIPGVISHGRTQMGADENLPVKKISDSNQYTSEYQYSANNGESSFATTETSLWHTPSVCTKKIDSKKFAYEKYFFLDGKWGKNERRGIIFLGNEYAALQVERSGENQFIISYLESSGSETGDDERKEKILWSKKISRFTPLTRNDNDFSTLPRNDEEFTELTQTDGEFDSTRQRGREFAQVFRNDKSFAILTKTDSGDVIPEYIGDTSLSPLKSKKAKAENNFLAFKMKFKAAKDGKTGVVRFFANGQISGKKISLKSKPFSTTNAHWVGGRYGWF